ncbi:MAG TPA: hypothetical protein VM677_09220 [Actinokineospora sp.]|jgi:hypothetical protein|nr:hypothetical protein [Actinokineospora sp.]
MPDFPDEELSLEAVTETRSLNLDPDLLAALEEASKPRTLDVFIATKYFGDKQSLPTDKRQYSAADLQAGVGVKTISSLRFSHPGKVPGYIHSVTLYAEDGCKGASATFYEGTEDLGDFKNRTCSIKIELWVE